MFNELQELRYEVLQAKENCEALLHKTEKVMLSINNIFGSQMYHSNLSEPMLFKLQEREHELRLYDDELEIMCQAIQHEIDALCSAQEVLNDLK